MPISVHNHSEYKARLPRSPHHSGESCLPTTRALVWIPTWGRTGSGFYHIFRYQPTLDQSLLRFSSVFYQKNKTQSREVLQPMKSSTWSHHKTSDTAGTHSSPAVTTRCQGWDPASLHLGWTWAEGGSYPTLLSPARPGWREAKKLQHQMHHKSFEAFFMFLYLSHISKLENPNILVLVYIQPHTPRPSMPIE